VTKGRDSVGDTQVTHEVLTGRCIDDFPTRKSARLRLEGFWKEREVEREREKRGRWAHAPFTVGRTGPQKGGWHGVVASDVP